MGKSPLVWCVKKRPHLNLWNFLTSRGTCENFDGPLQNPPVLCRILWQVWSHISSWRGIAGRLLSMRVPFTACPYKATVVDKVFQTSWYSLKGNSLKCQIDPIIYHDIAPASSMLASKIALHDYNWEEVQQKGGIGGGGLCFENTLFGSEWATALLVCTNGLRKQSSCPAWCPFPMVKHLSQSRRAVASWVPWLLPAH